ncbi:MAG: hypothetical protein UR69_C0001G0205 [Candidatus Moranbacteria bacterium GW2011_GWE2_35_2-]|nr:MAG: hypothetical protein UR69_C0001G0205 [Candidatus Moranbacteria bacterium GW2011_GWE2_35_2-]KKQ22797.1 MAG: hypothetical protein US37_C0001G0069 [Candidatus Moranbacteria bacterium GW2011_GWF2_37_11]KKQ28808.1 MAG: hypothetical protein US44_C0006G0028 [Candidatus Moranbacteria bacterium GW2011_GWD1_37_17]KKQ30972.1 MAG: hypothetical protein US47_C0001G0205 [Candidatus Moranbacteria bacterium GW2011_GWE1_37_24]KKQ47676.1 MAG: hypothetical protein US66_C0007G0007 [Candidatus Moranbacteria 
MSYLYLIIPPIVIVLSLSILLVLISRKSQNILAEKEKTENGDYKENQREGILKMSAGKFGQFLLRISEKSAISFKVFSLRVHNLLEKWLKYIKEKRAGNRKNISKEKNNKIDFDTKNKIISKEATIKKTEKEKVVLEMAIPVNRRKIMRRPMIRKSAVYPETPKIERKDELENILIERIASDPRDVEAYERLGDYYYGRRNTKDAIDCYKQVLKLSPVNRAVKIKLGRIGKLF